MNIDPTLNDFIEYVKDFYYGPNAVYKYSWDEYQIMEGCLVRYNTTFWGDGDSFDRESVRDYLIEKYGE